MEEKPLYEIEFEEQVELLLEQLRQKEITVSEFMKLLGMVWGDYVEFHPEKHPYYEDKKRIDNIGRNYGIQEQQ